MRIEKIIEGLQDEANEYARQALLKNLDGKDVSLAVGEDRGFYKGLTHALQRIQEIHAEEQARDRIQEPDKFD